MPVGTSGSVCSPFGEADCRCVKAGVRQPRPKTSVMRGLNRVDSGPHPVKQATKRADGIRRGAHSKTTSASQVPSSKAFKKRVASQAASHHAWFRVRCKWPERIFPSLGCDRSLSGMVAMLLLRSYGVSGTRHGGARPSKGASRLSGFAVPNNDVSFFDECRSVPGNFSPRGLQVLSSNPVALSPQSTDES